jgi:hypothetical protein
VTPTRPTKPIGAPQPVIVHSLAQARAALRAARALGCGIALRSAPGASSTVGAGWFAALEQILRREFPGVRFTAALDCGDKPGHALAALREGVRLIRLAAPRPVRDKVKSIAMQSGAALDGSRAPALDLARTADPEAAARRWLTPSAD